MSQGFLFSQMTLPGVVVDDLRQQNPWWEGKPMRVLPETHRHLVGQIERRLELELAPIVVVRGPRQIGKTTAQMQVVKKLFDRGVPQRNVLRLQLDELPGLEELEQPILRVVRWFEATILGCTLNEAAHRRSPTYLFLDEVQNIQSWAPQLKALVDHATTQVVVTGSSALRIEQGRDSLAGRMSTIEAGVLSLSEIGKFKGYDVGAPFLADNGLEPLTRLEFWRDLEAHGRAKARERDRSFALFSARGGYPLAIQRSDVPWEALADQLNETVIKRVIQHDLRVGERGRKRDATLLEELFRLACRYVGQAPDVQTLTRECQRALGANVGSERIRQYLRFLDGTLLIRLIQPLEIRLKKKRAAAKLCLADHALRASWLQEVVPVDPEGLDAVPHLATLAGRVAESIAGATLSTISGLDLAHLPARGDDPEIDFVLTIGTRRIPLEVKYQRSLDRLADTEGLRTFIEKSVNHAGFGVLVCLVDTVQIVDPRIVAMPLSTLMLLR
ncbi:MAG: AAA family ATPase [Planctomycetota bacterium]